MEIIDKIKQITLQKGWTIYQLSNEAGIGQSTLTNMFTRKTLPSITTLTKICNAFGITLSEFFQDEDDADNLTIKETRLLKEFRKLPDNKQDLLIELLK